MTSNDSKAVAVLFAVANATEPLTEVEIAHAARVSTREACAALHALCGLRLVGFLPRMPLRWAACRAACELLAALALHRAEPEDLARLASVDAAIEPIAARAARRA